MNLRRLELAAFRLGKTKLGAAVRSQPSLDPTMVRISGMSNTCKTAVRVLRCLSELSELRH